MLSANQFYNLIHDHGVENTTRAHMTSLWDIQRDKRSDALTKDGWGTNNYQFIEVVQYNTILFQSLLKLIKEVR